MWWTDDCNKTSRGTVMVLNGGRDQVRSLELTYYSRQKSFLENQFPLLNSAFSWRIFSNQVMFMSV